MLLVVCFRELLLVALDDPLETAAEGGEFFFVQTVQDIFRVGWFLLHVLGGFHAFLRQLDGQNPFVLLRGFSGDVSALFQFGEKLG